MPENPHTGLLDRTLFRQQIAETFAEQLLLLEQLVNYGTNLIVRSFESSEKDIPEVVVILSFLKHAVTSLDAIHILAKEGSTLACQPHMRSLMEINLYLKWIFMKDYQRRGTAYRVWEIRRQRYWYRCYLDGTREQKANMQHMKGELTEGLEPPLTQEQLREFIEEEDAKPQTPELREVNELFNEKVSKSGKDRDWYVPFGVSDLRTMAVEVDKNIGVGEEGMYKLLYSHYSNTVHGLSMDHQWHFDEALGQVIFDHIRTVESLDEVFQMAFSYTFMLYRKILNEYRPGEIGAYNRRYVAEWRDASINIPKVEITDTGFTIAKKKPSVGM